MSEFQELLGNYSKCYGKTSLKFGASPVLILIDPVVAYLEPSSPLYAPKSFEAARLSMVRLLAKARSSTIPVIFTSVVYNSPSEGGKWYMEKLPNVLCCYE
ncbi:hypothetical protein HYALB_00003450 [Hymenoscyphus albidus]|uniref:Uncharacterized protein n=1 Tax=Hymenoscyphus albidus TaxID=595503 RepID=A0A9N9PWJ3_9HELO|nr:hypothetical protein HYALB_00003450 [Hymenoscyphus albidus]